MTKSIEILTVGHSTLPYESFLQLLRGAGVTAIADVRTSPYSRHNAQFNRETLRDELGWDGITYVFLGDELGGRPKDSDLFQDGVADYEKMSRTDSFARGLKRVIEGAKKYRLAMMCSEHDPLDCHRCLLVGRALHDQGVSVKHVLSNGSIIDQRAIEDRLLALSGKATGDLFAPEESTLAEAYRARANRVAYSETDADRSGNVAAE